MTTGRRAGFRLALPALLLVTATLLLPLALLGRYSLNRFEPKLFMVEAVTGANYLALASDPYYRGMLGTTVWIAALCTVICLVAGFPAAWALARAEGRIRSIGIILTVLPLFVGNAVRAAGWMLLLGDSGVINRTLSWLGLAGEPVKLMYSPTAVILGICAVNLPYVILTLQSAIEGIDRSVEAAALSLGAKPLSAFWRVTLPLAAPGVIVAGSLCFILGMNAYATPVLLGGPQFQMLAPAVYLKIIAQANWPSGAALAFLMTGATMALTLIASKLSQYNR